MKKVAGIPFIAVGADELAEKRRRHGTVHKGDKIFCHRCGKRHLLKAGTTDGVETELLLFYKCGKSAYLYALDNVPLDLPNKKE